MILDKMQFVLKRLYRMTGIPIRCLDEKGERAWLSMGLSAESDPVVQDRGLFQELASVKDKHKLPILVGDDEGFVYGVFCLESLDIVVFGPVCQDPADAVVLRRYARKHLILADGSFYGINRSHGELAAALALASHLLTGSEADEDEIIRRSGRLAGQVQLNDSELEQYRLGIMDADLPRLAYDEERQFVQLIQNGNVEAIRSFFDPAALNRAGKLAKKVLKNQEYLACAAITLATRAAIEGGVEPLAAYSISDLLLQKLEKCGSVPEVYVLLQDALSEFATKVRDARLTRSRSSYVEGCKAYISTHLSKSFTLDDAAAATGIDKSYLCRLFAAETGLGIRAYTRQKRIEAAVGLLVHSDRSIAEIAAFLCFPSQSHFGKVFKDFIGMTPQTYRKQFKRVV